MTVKGYCTFNETEMSLGVTFTLAQQQQCEAIIERAESYIDEYTGRAWLTGAQADEAHYVDSQNVFLKYAPVASVTSITGRAGLGESEETLMADDDYEVRDLINGHIVLTSPNNYDRVLITYTPVATVPADLKQACIDIVSAWLQPTLRPGMYGIDSYSLPDMSVKFSRSHVQQAVPPAANVVLNRYRYIVHA